MLKHCYGDIHLSLRSYIIELWYSGGEDLGSQAPSYGQCMGTQDVSVPPGHGSEHPPESTIVSGLPGSRLLMASPQWLFHPSSFSAGDRTVLRTEPACSLRLEPRRSSYDKQPQVTSFKKMGKYFKSNFIYGLPITPVM